MTEFIIGQLKSVLKKALLVFFAGAALVLGSNAWVKKTARGKCYSTVETIPSRPVGLVLGCSPLTQGGVPNPFFTARIAAAAELYKAEKVRCLIVSGDNGTQAYDEPTAMKAALMEAGVPEGQIYCDYAGFRTLDSVVRTDAIFGQNRFTIISQHFHNERALFLAERHELDAIAFDAKDVSRALAPTTDVRELLARVQAVFDTLMHTKPKFYGQPVKIQGL